MIHGFINSHRFFPSHYAPMVSDVVDIAEMKIDFILGEPFRPFEQVRYVIVSSALIS